MMENNPNPKTPFQKASLTEQSKNRWETNEQKLMQTVLSQWLGVPIPINDRRRITLAADHLEALTRKFNFLDGVEEEKLKEAWQQVAGEFVAKNTEVVSVKGGIVTVKVLQPSLRFHLEQIKGSLKKRLIEVLGAKVVKEVRLIYG